jgi:endonuclease III
MRLELLVGSMTDYAESIPEYALPEKTKKFTSYQANNFLLGILFDRGVKYELAEEAGKVLNKLLGDKSDPKKVWQEILKIRGPKLEKFMLTGNNGKAFHRFWRTYAHHLPETAKHMLNHYEGDARLIWQDHQSPKVIEKKFDDLPLIGPAIAKMAVKILVKNYGLILGRSAFSDLDVKPDVHVTRVFKRSALVGKDANWEVVVQAARKWVPKDPSILDTAGWNIGREWCFATKPDCKNCPVSPFCIKLTKIK